MQACRKDTTGAEITEILRGSADRLGWPITPDAAAAVQTQYTYEPFGAVATMGPTSGNLFQYTVSFR